MAFKDSFFNLNGLAEKASRFKDYGISKGGEQLLRYYLREYGRVNTLNVNTRDKSVECEVLLNGESEPLRAELRDYSIEHHGEKSYISFKGVTTSREWINTLAGKYFVRRRFEIPGEYAKLLDRML
jgi:hypothetical protein